MLTEEQRKVARMLLTERPAVIDHTRVIFNDQARKHWYEKVTTTMLQLQISTPEDIRDFCDIAGVPD